MGQNTVNLVPVSDEFSNLLSYFLRWLSDSSIWVHVSMGGLRVGCCPECLLWEMLERISALKSTIWVKCQPYDTRRVPFQGDNRVRVWGDCRLGLKEHVRCHGILKPKASPA